MSWLIDFWHMIWPHLGRGLLVTLKLSGGALLIGFLLGLPTALIRVYGSPWAKRLATLYVDVFRGTPLLVQLFFIYYGLADPHLTTLAESIGLPPSLLVLPPMTAAYAALGLNSGAYQAEYFRGAIQAVSGGQMMAARALGMSRWQAIRHIVLPQALRIAIPPWSNEAAYLVKYTSVVYIIAVPDLFGEARRIMSVHYNQMIMLPFVGFIYLLMVLFITWVMGKVEAALRIPGLEMEEQERF